MGSGGFISREGVVIMKLRVMCDGVIQGNRVRYHIFPEEGREVACCTSPEEHQTLIPLMSRIRKMAKRQLGEYFIALIEGRPDEGLYLMTHVGASTAKKRELSELFGWIALYQLK